MFDVQTKIISCRADFQWSLLFVAWPQDGKKIYSVDTHKKCAEKE